MNAPQGILVALAVSAGIVAGAMLAWGVSKRWYGRRLRAARQAALESDQNTLAAQENVLRARRHIDALTSELAVNRQAVVDSEAELLRARANEQVLIREAELAAATVRHGADTAHGFADTQLMS